MENEVVERERIGELVAFDELRAGIILLKEMNANKVFDYADPAGNKDARSHIYRLRQTKTQIADVHKTVKAKALRACQLIDAEKRDLTSAVDEMIDVHLDPIKEIERQEAVKEAERLQAILEKKAVIEAERLEAIAQQEAEIARRQAELDAKEKAAQRVEEDALNALAIEESRIAAERAKFEAEKKAEINARLREDAARKQAQIDAAYKAKVEQDRLEVEKVKKIQAEQDEKKRLAVIEKKRVEDKIHRTSIEVKVFNKLGIIITNCSYDADKIQSVFEAIVNGKIPNVTINY